ncbi:hypothetical protein VRRI112168_07220 [Vreelandella rituensis]
MVGGPLVGRTLMSQLAGMPTSICYFPNLLDIRLLNHRFARGSLSAPPLVLNGG